ncbi:MAG: peptidoglycan-associated lipoprotein Pal [Acidobacteriota bacterium]
MVMRTAARRAALLVLVFGAVAVAACGKKTPPVARALPPPAAPSGSAAAPARPPAPPEAVPDPAVVPPEPVREDSIASASLDDLNRNSPIMPVFFEYDSSDLSGEAQAILDANATALKKYASWTITIEGHSDERGTAEYNLALGERRAVTARAYLVSLGIPGDRLRTVSYGKEFPFDPGHDDSAWSKNRRAHFVITAK